MEMDMGDLDMGFDWSQLDIHSNVSPTLLDFPTHVPQQVNEPSVQDSVGTVVPTPNMAHNTEEANSSSMGGNPPQLSVNDPYQLPLLSQNTSAPLLDLDAESNCYIPSMVGLISEGAGSSVQAQNITTLMNYTNQYPLIQNNNHPLMQELGQVNEQNTSNQLLVSDMIANPIFNEINAQSSSYPPYSQQNLVNVQAGAWSGTANGSFMINQASPAFALNNHGINPSSAWNSPRSSLWAQDDQGNRYNSSLQNPSFQQQSSTMNGPTPLSSGFATSSVLNSATLGLSGTRFSGGSSSQVFNNQAPQFSSLLRPERAPGVQQQQVPPLSVNTLITPQRAGNDLAALATTTSFRAQTSVPGLSMWNQNDRSTFGAYGSYSTQVPNPRGQREPPRRGRPRKHFEPGQIIPPYKRRKRGNPGKKPLSGENNNSVGVVIREDQNPRNPSSDATASREQVNAMYDPAFERAGVPIDPILRLFNASSAEKPAEEGAENPN